MKRYTVYFYELQKQWFVWDTQTNCMVGGTGTIHKALAEHWADTYNLQQS